MEQGINGLLAVSFTCPVGLVQGDIVEIVDENEVDIVKTTGSLAIVGQICAKRRLDTVCTVSTRFLRRRDDRVAGENITAVGPFVFGADNEVFAYDDKTHSPAAIAGLVTTLGDHDDAVETLELV